MARGTRRDVLRLGLVLGAAVLIMARPWQGARQLPLVFEPIAELPPLRRLSAAGATSAGAPGQAALVGLAPPPDPGLLARMAALRPRLCETLGLSWSEGGPVPVTYFTDIRCPTCRTLERDLAALGDADPALFRLRTREFPVFGPRSEAAARLIRAADAQDGGEAMRRHLQSRPVPGTAEARAALAGALGLDAVALDRAWEAPATHESLAEDLALVRLLGLPGTPGLVVGRTVVIGALPRRTLAALLDAEQAAGPPAECA